MQAEKPEHKPKRKNKAHSYRTRFMVIIGCVLLLAGAIVYFLPQLFPVHLKISNIESVRIDNSWSGLARGAPFISNFDLTMQNGMLMGTAKFASGYDYSSDGNLVETHGSVMIPREVVEEFRKSVV